MSASFTDSIGGAVGSYVVGIIADWLEKLKTRRLHDNYEFTQEFAKAVSQQQLRPGEGRIFHQTTEWMIRTLANVVWIDDPERVDHLKPLLNLLTQQERLVVATLNYDNSIELLANSHTIPVTTGIDEWSKTGTFNLDDDGLYLLKLHGSIDWVLDKGLHSDERPMPQSTIRTASSDEVQKAGFRPAVIFGQRNKLTAEGPFLDLLRAFQLELSKTDSLTIIGYSFRDIHINEYLSQWLNQSVENKLRIISPSFDRSAVPYAMQLRQSCSSRIEMISEKAGKGLQTAFGSPI